MHPKRRSEPLTLAEESGSTLRRLTEATPPASTSGWAVCAGDFWPRGKEVKEKGGPVAICVSACDGNSPRNDVGDHWLTYHCISMKG